MTRIIAGSARGHSIVVPPHGTRPTSDRVREAVFSMIEARVDVEGAQVLDLYAGSGALGLEALSRGAERAVFVESDRAAAKTIERNAQVLGIAGATVWRRDVTDALGVTASSRFTLVFADPPYDVASSDVEDVVAKLVSGGWLADDALIVVERAKRSADIAWPSAMEVLADKFYGDTRVIISRLDS